MNVNLTNKWPKEVGYYICVVEFHDYISRFLIRVEDKSVLPPFAPELDVVSYQFTGSLKSMKSSYRGKAKFSEKLEFV